MKVLVTGANGMLGQDLCPILEDIGCYVIETDKDNLDITNGDLVNAVMEDVKPNLVIHCAAYTNVEKAEEEYELAHKINALGTENIAKACSKFDTTLIYISTDYVFDGKKSTAYTPLDETNPLNKYGLTKLQGEEAIKKYCEKYYIARTSWLYGHHGKNFVETVIANSEKDSIKIVNDQFGCPTWTVELANCIIKLLQKPYGIYHICGSGITSWYEFAKEIHNQLNIECKFSPCSSNEYTCKAKRPKNSAMDNSGFCRDWKTALKDYLALRA
ncbi:MAG: dTDP-4-dehydrorhamnose reductase [Cyanobacteria bacterium SIG28]|nr:dTDP-4-dehydrorhamnose reductase [Cyanobacteria bacterium SIG28]